MGRSFLSLLVSVALILLAYSLHFNVDFSDESFYLYYFQQGPSDVTFNFHHVFIHFLGVLFDHKLIFYRYLSLFTILGSAFYLAKKNEHFSWQLPVSLGLLYFNLPSTFSYNTVSLVGGTFLIASLIGLKNASHQSILAVGMGLASFLVLSARLAPGVLFLMLSCFGVMFTEVSEKKKILGLMVLSFCVLLGLTLALWWPSFQMMGEIIQVISASSHKGLALAHVKSALGFTPKAVLPPLLLILISQKWLRSRPYPLYTYFSWIVIQRLLIEFDFSGFSYYFSGILVALTLVEIYPELKARKLSEETVLFLLLPLGFFFTSSIGSNNNFLKNNCYNLLMVLPVISKLFLKKDYSWMRPTLSWGMAALALVSVYRNQYWKYYRNPPRETQNYVSSSFPTLKGIQIDRPRELALETVSEFYKEHSFDPQVDRIVAYPDSPGFVSLFEAKALGTPWHMSNYDRSVETNCSHMKRDKLPPGGRVFVVALRPLPSEMEDCILAKSSEVLRLRFDPVF